MLFVNSCAKQCRCSKSKLNPKLTIQPTVATAIDLDFPPHSGGFRKIPDTNYIFYAPSTVDKRVMGGVELVGTTIVKANPTTFNDGSTFTTITDVQGFLQGGKLRFLLVAYKEYDKVTTDSGRKVLRAKFKVFRNPSESAPATVALTGGQCGTRFVDGCKTCDIPNNKCTECKDQHGNFKLRPPH